MRIVQIVPHYVPSYYFGGVLHVAHALSKALLVLEHEVRVCTTNLKDRRCDLDVPVSLPCQVDGVTVYYEATSLSRYWGFSPTLARQIRQQVAWADVVFIHFHYQFASVVGGWICRLLRKPYIIFTHGSLNRDGISLRSHTLKQLYLRLLEHGNFRQALFAAYHSQEERENSFCFGRYQIVPNGVDPQAFEPLPAKGSFRVQYPALQDRLLILYLGRLDAGKGLDLLLPAFRHLVDRCSDVHLVLAGGDEKGYESSLQQMVSNLQIQEHVTFTGLIGGDLKLAALQDSDIYVLPSRSEGLSIAMLEAMYMGLPVIVSDRVGLWRAIEAERCGLVVPLDVAPLADALLSMATQPNRAEMGAHAAELVQTRYTWPTITQNLLARLENSLSL